MKPPLISPMILPVRLAMHYELHHCWLIPIHPRDQVADQSAYRDRAPQTLCLQWEEVRGGGSQSDAISVAWLIHHDGRKLVLDAVCSAMFVGCCTQRELCERFLFSLAVVIQHLLLTVPGLDYLVLLIFSFVFGVKGWKLALGIGYIYWLSVFCGLGAITSI